MPSLVFPELFLCADGGGTSVTVAIASATGGILARGSAGPCNVLTVGPSQALTAILQATQQALAVLDVPDSIAWQDASSSSVPAFQRRVFKGVWLGLAGITSREDEVAFRPLAHEAFAIPLAEVNALRVTNDGHLLASPCSLIPHVDSAVVLVAGTGTVGISFRKDGTNLVCSGISGGWGYLLGDEGSAYAVARLAMRSILTSSDALQSHSFLSPLSPPPPQLALHTALLKHFGVPTAAALVAKTYRDHSTPLDPSFESAEANRKVWIAESTRIVFAYAFGEVGLGATDDSRTVALGIAAESARSLVDIAVRLVGEREIVDPRRAALALGGGLWKATGYSELVVRGLAERGIQFAEVVTVGDPAQAGVLALVAQGNQRK
ncbi:hypothetical protein RQP46_005118 [Phenoliferia psychrophenolica]